jgi:2-haloacid dehalogenase
VVARQVKALLFDVFGTVVDWRSGVIRDVTAVAGRAGVPVDAARFADRWRAGYRPAMDLVRSGALPWTKLDDLHRRVLDELAGQSGLAGLPPAELDWLNRSWHRLDPWPDSVPGLTRLRPRYVLATMSNGNVALLANMARRAGLPWDVILSAELFRRYKPDPQTYLGAAELLSLDPAELMLVAAHNDDLRAAAGLGLATAFVPRPTEYGPGQQKDLTPAGDYTVVATDLTDLATQLTA